MRTLGKKISDYRKAVDMTQEELAEKMNVSSQAVSKWENDLSIPDLSTLIGLADLFQVTMDELVRQEETLPEVRMMPEVQKKPIEQLILRIRFQSDGGDSMKVNLPLMLVKTCMEMGGDTSMINFGVNQKTLQNIDLEQVLKMADIGIIGKLVELHTEDGEHMEIYVE